MNEISGIITTFVKISTRCHIGMFFVGDMSN